MKSVAPCHGSQRAIPRLVSHRGVYVQTQASSSGSPPPSSSTSGNRLPGEGNRMENFSRWVKDDSWTRYEEVLRKEVEAGRGLRSIDNELACSENVLEGECYLPSGPYCPYMGPIPTLRRPELEVLYKQARESFYSGRPMLSDAVYDEVELRLRLLRSPLVRKFPRCSLTKSRPMYADAEEDYVQVSLLAVLWGAFFMAGFSALLTPVFLTWLQYANATGSVHGAAPQAMSFPLLTLTAVGALVGLPLVTTSYRCFNQVKEGFIVAMKGQCPHCGHEVYAFLSTNTVADRPKFVREASECHVCGQKLEFRAFILDKKLFEVPGEDPVPAWSPIKNALKRWAYGRVYGRSSVEDLTP